MPFPLLAAAAPSIIAGAASLAGGLMGNSARRKEASKDRAFQLQMAQNAHQYEVADLRAAGLNPILSGTGGPGARASGGSKADQQDPITPAVNSAMAAARMQQEIDNLKAQEQNTKMDTALKSTQINAQQSIAPMNQATEKVSLAQEERVKQEVKNLQAQEASELQRKLLLLEQTEQTKQEGRLKKVQADVEKWMYDHNLSETAKVLGLGGGAADLLKLLIQILRK